MRCFASHSMTAAPAISPSHKHLFRFVANVSAFDDADVRRLFAPQTLSTCCVNLDLAGFTSSPKIVAARTGCDCRSTITCAGLVAIAFIISGCKIGGTPPTTSGFEPPVDLRQKEINQRKEEIIRQLAQCESGGWVPSDRLIHGGRGAYLGRLQFISTVVAYQKRRDGAASRARRRSIWRTITIAPARSPST